MESNLIVVAGVAVSIAFLQVLFIFVLFLFTTYCKSYLTNIFTIAVQILGICFAQNLRADIFAQVFHSHHITVIIINKIIIFVQMAKWG